MDFNDFYWPDAIIKNITIDRNDPGNVDEIEFEIEWSEDQGESTIIFQDVYWANFKMNFGIISQECIETAFILDKDDNQLNDFYKKFKWLIDDIKVFCYVIKTISTESEIRIIAKGFRIEPKIKN